MGLIVIILPLDAKIMVFVLKYVNQLIENSQVQ